MKRIAAVAAATIGMLAIPAAAMASTGSSGGSGNSATTYSATTQLQPKECYVGHDYVKKDFDWWRDGREVTTVYCPFPKVIPLPDQCSKQIVTFSVDRDSSVLTEVSGPQLSPNEVFVYDGNTYTVMSINPGADQFTASVNSLLFVNNSGAAITNATGIIISCSS